MKNWSCFFSLPLSSFFNSVRRFFEPRTNNVCINLLQVMEFGVQVGGKALSLIVNISQLRVLYIISHNHTSKAISVNNNIFH